MSKDFIQIKNYYENLYGEKGGDSFIFDEKRTLVFTDLCKPILGEECHILDIGCGVGYACDLMKNAGFKVHGVDISEKAITEAKKRVPDGVFTLAESSGKLGYDADSFNALLCLGVLEHIINPDAVVRETYRVLKRGGTAVFLVPNSLSPYFFFSKGTGQIMEVPRKKEGWLKMFTDAGFSLKSITKDPGPTVMPDYSSAKKFKLFLNRILNLLPVDFTYQFVFVLEKK